MNQPFPNQNGKPFLLWSLPKFPKTAMEVVADPEHLQQNLIDILGCGFFQRRDDILAYIRLLADDEQYRSKLGTLKRKPYDALAGLDDADQQIALAIAEGAMDCLIEQICGMLSDAPTWYEDRAIARRKA